ncbi:hypothetical protein COV94_03055 [Candidatus Woesearchaeota archaeon CG11_big_fil_rev_8_21_14_0_20_57_5]|nr:MAG: hypothetical protein COV94_03055 [Candidatus Woesearchaeota archaeon CG11_big_fil_rev_8_21_14_0_20_57_5]
MAVALLSEHQSVAFQHQDMDQEALRGARRALTFAYDLSTFIPSLLHMLKERRMFPSLSELACDAGRDCYRLEEPSAWQQELRDADLVGAIARETLSTLSSPFTYWLPSKAAQHADSPTRQTARIARLERVRLARESGIAHRITELITLPEVTDLLAVYHQSHHPGVQDALAGMLELRAWQLPTDEQCCWPTAAYGF